MLFRSDVIFCDQMTRLINGDRFYYFWRLQDGLISATHLIGSIVTREMQFGSGSILPILV